ncbi:restriction endonuclease subunit S [Nocardioides sp. R1-1]|uniref:restriction endonuclease subunit S n=1 Tax=Nocardioides sp. R1-1 TaxID=3383502 RepID=UPI0038D1C411
MTDAAFTDLLSAIIDNRGRTAPTAESGIPLIATNCIKDNALYPVKEKVRYVDNETYRTWFRGHPEPGDILFVCKGSPGRTALVPNPVDFVVAQDMVAVRADATKIYPRFLLAALRSPGVRGQVENMHVGSLIPHFKKGDFDKLRIPTPARTVQEAVGDLYFAMSEKIESNRRSAEIELELAAALLVGGTETIRVGDVADVDKGLSYKGAGLDDGSATNAIPMVNLGSFSTSGALKPDGLKYYTGDFKQKHRLAAWDLVVANTDLTQSREILGRGFLVPSTLQGALHTHHTSVVRFRERSELAPFLWARLQSPEFRDRAKGFATGTTVTALPREALLDYEFSVPSNPELSLAAARGLIEHSWQLAAESAAVTRTRDALLPELLSGRIRVPEADAVVQDGTE